MGNPVKRRRFSAKEKARIAVAAIKGDKTIAQLSSDFGCHASKVSQWKKEALEGLAEVFAGKPSNAADERQEAALYEQIGRLKVELEWLKKKLGGAS